MDKRLNLNPKKDNIQTKSLKNEFIEISIAITLNFFSTDVYYYDFHYDYKKIYVYCFCDMQF